MAKRGVLEHPKTIELATALEIPECFAVGVLECFWQHVARYFPNGEITGLKPGVLARSIRYAGDPQTLWEALIACGFLDLRGDRTFVHDWSEHSDNSVHQLLKKRGETFADGHGPFTRNRVREVNGSAPRVGSSQTVHEPFTNGSLPNVVDSRLPEPEPEPEESKPVAAAKSLARAHANGGDFEEISDSEEAAAAVLKANPNAVYRWIGAALTRKQREEWLAQVAGHFEAGRIVTTEHLDAAAAAAERDFRERGNGAKRTMGWFYTALKEVLNPAEDPPEPPAETREQWEKRWRLVFHPERRAECLAELIAATGNPEATEKAREHLRFALRLNGFMGAEIEEEAAEVEAAAREKVPV